MNIDRSFVIKHDENEKLFKRANDVFFLFRSLPFPSLYSSSSPLSLFLCPVGVEVDENDV